MKPHHVYQKLVSVKFLKEYSFDVQTQCGLEVTELINFRRARNSYIIDFRYENRFLCFVSEFPL